MTLNDAIDQPDLGELLSSVYTNLSDCFTIADKCTLLIPSLGAIQVLCVDSTLLRHS